MTETDFSCYLPSRSDEDSPPVADGNVLVVSDGCGYGSSRVEHMTGDVRTQAWFASRIVTRVCSIVLKNRPADRSVAETAEALRNALREALSISVLREEFNISENAADVIFPATLAAAVCDGREDGTVRVSAFWAGDSRVYILDPDGLKQLSRDDAPGEFDPFAAKDSAMNNSVKNARFYINYAECDVRMPCICFVCTDGLFEYERLSLDITCHYIIGILLNILAEKTANPAAVVERELSERLSGDDRTIAFRLLAKDENELEIFAESLKKIFAQYEEDSKLLAEIFIEEAALDDKLREPLEAAYKRRIDADEALISDIRAAVEKYASDLINNTGTDDEWSVYLRGITGADLDFIETENARRVEQERNRQHLTVEINSLQKEINELADRLRTVLTEIKAFKAYHDVRSSPNKRKSSAARLSKTGAGAIFEEIRQNREDTFDLSELFYTRVREISEGLTGDAGAFIGDIRIGEICLSVPYSPDEYSGGLRELDDLRSKLDGSLNLARELCIGFVAGYRNDPKNKTTPEELNRFINGGFSDDLEAVFDLYGAMMTPGIRDESERMKNEIISVSGLLNEKKQEFSMISGASGGFETAEELRNRIRKVASGRIVSEILTSAQNAVSEEDKKEHGLFLKNLPHFAVYCAAYKDYDRLREPITRLGKRRSAITDKYRKTYELYKIALSGRTEK